MLIARDWEVGGEVERVTGLTAGGEECYEDVAPRGRSIRGENCACACVFVVGVRVCLHAFVCMHLSRLCV